MQSREPRRPSQGGPCALSPSKEQVELLPFLLYGVNMVSFWPWKASKLHYHWVWLLLTFSRAMIIQQLLSRRHCPRCQRRSPKPQRDSISSASPHDESRHYGLSTQPLPICSIRSRLPLSLDGIAGGVKEYAAIAGGPVLYVLSLVPPHIETC